MKKILGVGNALVDVLIRLGNDRELDELNLPKGSMQLVNRKRSDEILKRLSGTPASLEAGGSAANTMHGIAMLGASAGYIGTIGMDDLGATFEQNMISAGVEPFLFRSPTETGRAITLITPDSERTFATCLGAAVELSEEQLSRIWYPGSNLLSAYHYLHIEGFLVQNHGLVKMLASLARESSLIVSLDLASYNVVEANLAFLKEICRDYVDILFANEEEAAAFTGQKPEEAVHRIGQFCEIAVVKTGPRGSLVRSGAIFCEVEALPAVPIDTTGAGDLYASGFLYGHSRGWSLEECGKAGALLASQVIEETGAKMPQDRWNRVKRKLEIPN
jgi:sugar/nucleoside kinase (ribokinase family)